MRNLKLIIISLTVLALLGGCAKKETVATTAATTEATPVATPEVAPAESTEAAPTEPVVEEEPEAVVPDEPVTPAPTPSQSAPSPMLPRRGEVASMADVADPATTQRISVPDALEKLQSGEAVMVDVRNADAFQFQHITDSVSIPLNQVMARAGELPQDKWIITYCTCPAEETSGAAATQLKNMGFQRAAALLGGMQAWRAAGLPLELGP